MTVLARDALPLAAAVALVTGGAAAAAGLDDRGGLLPGTRADILIADLAPRWPEVRAVLRAR